MKKNILTIIILFAFLIANGQSENYKAIGLFFSNNISLIKYQGLSIFDSDMGYGYNLGGDYCKSLTSKINLKTGLSYTAHRLNFKDNITYSGSTIIDDGVSQRNLLTIPIGLEYRPIKSFLISLGIAPTYLIKVKSVYERTILPENTSDEFSNTVSYPFSNDYIFIGYFTSVGYVFEINSNFELPIMFEYNLHAIKSSKLIRDNDYMSSIGLKIEIRYKWK
jgi:hypothetical protein